MKTRRVGGMLEAIPELLTYVLHGWIGHPVNKVQPTTSPYTGKPSEIYGWCTECGANTHLTKDGK